MRKNDVIQLAVIILGLIIAFLSIQYVLSVMGSMVYAFSAGDFSAASFSGVIPVMILAVLQGAISFIVVSKSKGIAATIYQRSGIGTGFKIISQPEDLLFVLLIIIGFYFW